MYLAHEICFAVILTVIFAGICKIYIENERFKKELCYPFAIGAITAMMLMLWIYIIAKIIISC